jgi:hypothetical protein
LASVKDIWFLDLDLRKRKCVPIQQAHFGIVVRGGSQ